MKRELRFQLDVVRRLLRGGYLNKEDSAFVKMILDRLETDDVEELDGEERCRISDIIFRYRYKLEKLEWDEKDEDEK